MSFLLDFISVLCIVAGLAFFLGTAAGVVRFPDFYTRMHAAGKGDTLSTILILLGASLHVLADFSWLNVLVALKILAIAGFIMLTSPTSTHALLQAGYDDGLEPFAKPEPEEDLEEKDLTRP